MISKQHSYLKKVTKWRGPRTSLSVCWLTHGWKQTVDGSGKLWRRLIACRPALSADNVYVKCISLRLVCIRCLCSQLCVCGRWWWWCSFVIIHTNTSNHVTVSRRLCLALSIAAQTNALLNLRNSTVEQLMLHCCCGDTTIQHISRRFIVYALFT